MAEELLWGCSFGVTWLLEGRALLLDIIKAFLGYSLTLLPLELLGCRFCLRAIWNIPGVSKPTELLEAHQHLSGFSM